MQKKNVRLTFLSPCQDTYTNLTLKTVMGLKWGAIFCPQAKYVMKTDDDIFINVPLLHRALQEERFERITGIFILE